MNVFGELILYLLGTGFVWGVILTSIGWFCYVLLLKMHYEEEIKRK